MGASAGAHSDKPILHAQPLAFAEFGIVIFRNVVDHVTAGRELLPVDALEQLVGAARPKAIRTNARSHIFLNQERGFRRVLPFRKGQLDAMKVLPPSIHWRMGDLPRRTPDRLRIESAIVAAPCTDRVGRIGRRRGADVAIRNPRLLSGVGRPSR